MATSRWYRSDTKRPAFGEVVIVAWRREDVEGSPIEVNLGYIRPDGAWIGLTEVTHWMRLPEIPRD